MQSIKPTLLPCPYFGSIEFFCNLISNECVIEVNDYFVKQSLRTRCNIYGANGLLTLTVPKSRKNSSKTLFKDIKINYDHQWQKEHWESLTSAYRSSPFFEYYEHELQSLFQKKYTFLKDLNLEMMTFVCSKIGISTEFNLSESYINNLDYVDKRMYNFDKIELPRYIQVFENKFGFISNLSILDLLFNEGNNSKYYLETINL
tara:strand:- start:4247 stop:4855 length:609 start_codon:yes stop_codon:yes gene_type:complete